MRTHPRFLVVAMMFLAAPAAHAAAPVQPESPRAVEESYAEALIAPVSAVTSPPAPAASPTSTISVGRIGSAYMNVSFDTLLDLGWSTSRGGLNLGGHDPASRGFTMPNSELVLDGAVDPYFKGVADIVLSLDADGETAVELEESYLLTTALPWNLQIKAGQFFTELGRHNPQHPHQWAFVDQPLVIGRMFGPDGLRSPGMRLSWLVPTSWYAEVMVAILNGQGETAWSFRSGESVEIHGGEPVERPLRGAGDLVYVPRATVSFDLSDTQTVVAGASAALGPNNSGPRAATRVYGVDAYWKWRAVSAQAGFPFLSWQTEALYRSYEADSRAAAEDEDAALPAETLHDWGGYSQVLWGFTRGWVVGLRGELVAADDGAFASELRRDRTRVAANVTWYPTEFSKTRLQYNHDRGDQSESDHSLWLQVDFLLGAHAAHKF
ncbi:MAG: hypothetical protein HYV63_34535 [Candidatus Schekmanbacteria bacterium]|nr:hypothetical protein [Candidatus Schekmanbacteria bacterium]